MKLLKKITKHKSDIGAGLAYLVFVGAILWGYVLYSVPAESSQHIGSFSHCGSARTGLAMAKQANSENNKYNPFIQAHYNAFVGMCARHDEIDPEMASIVMGFTDQLIAIVNVSPIDADHIQIIVDDVRIRSHHYANRIRIKGLQ